MADRAIRRKIFGRVLREKRIAKGYEDLQDFAERVGISNQHLSQVETGYSRVGRPPVGLSDDVIDSISKALDWRVTDMRHMLGQIPDEELQVEMDPDFQFVGDAYYGVPDAGRRMIKSAAELALEMSREGAIGGKRAE